MAEKPSHRPGGYLPIVAAVLAFVIAMVFTALSSLPQAGVFVSSTGNISDAYYIEITPAGWTFSIWGVIYTYQVLILIYALSTICRRHGDDGYLYYSPPYLPSSIYIVYVINLAFNVSWLFLFDREQMLAALVVLALIVATLYVLMIVSIRGIQMYGQSLVSTGQRREIIWVWALVHNGFGTYLAWTSIATLLNLAIVLTYVAGMDQELTSTISLGVLAFEALLWAVLDNTVLERFTRYLFTPYLVLIVALAGSLARNWEAGKRNSIFTAVLMGVAVLITIIKIVVSIYRHRTKPLFPPQSEGIKQSGGYGTTE